MVTSIINTHGQRGAALLITLILITLVSLLVFSNSQSVRLQQQLSSNGQASQMAFQAAEMALKQAAYELESSVDLSQLCNVSKSYAYIISDVGQLQDDKHWEEAAANGKPVSFNTGGYTGAEDEGGYGAELVPQLPRYIIGCIDTDAIADYVRTQSIEIGQEMPEEDQHYFFRVFAVGFGPAGKIRSTLEAHYVY